MSEREVKVMEKEIAPVVAVALGIVIASDKDMKFATETLSKLNKVNDKITDEKEKVTKPLNQALAAERARWKPAELMYKKGIDWLRSELSRYQTMKVKESREEETRIAARMGEGRGKLKVETAVRKMGEVEQPEKRVETTEGMVSFRTDKVLKILDESLIPRKYMRVDEEAALAALIAGVDVPGAVVEEVQRPINKRK